MGKRTRHKGDASRDCAGFHRERSRVGVKDGEGGKLKIKCKDCGIKVTKRGNNRRCVSCAASRRRVKCGQYDRARRNRKAIREAVRSYNKGILVVPQNNGKVRIYAREDYIDLI
jgi:hypothetical protein